MKELVFRSSSYCFTDLFLFFTGKKKYSKVLNVGVHRTSTGPSCGTSWGPNDRKFYGRLRDVGQTCFLNSTYKHIKLILTGYSRLDIEL